VELKCEASGQIETVYVKEGQRVQKGDKILTIDPERLLLSKERLDLEAKEARIRQDIAEREYERALELIETGTIPQSRLDDLKSEYELKAIAYRKQLLQRKDIADQLKKTTVVSPMAGVLTHLNVEEGEIAVSATSGYQSGTAIGTVADISRLEVVTQIGEVDYIKLAQGQRVVIRPEAIEDAQTHGTIQFISLTAKKQGSDELGNFEVRISVDSLIPGVVPGVNVNVDFVVLEKKGVLAVPYHFVQKRGDRSIVLRPAGDEDKEGAEGKRKPGPGREMTGSSGARRDEGKKSPKGKHAFRPTRVTTGSTDFRHIEILSGLAEGDTVVYRKPAKDSEERGGSRGGRR
jgi:RND family efflux transporter MFP subunit